MPIPPPSPVQVRLGDRPSWPGGVAATPCPWSADAKRLTAARAERATGGGLWSSPENTQPVWPRPSPSRGVAATVDGAGVPATTSALAPVGGHRKRLGRWSPHRTTGGGLGADGGNGGAFSKCHPTRSKAVAADDSRPHLASLSFVRRTRVPRGVGGSVAAPACSAAGTRPRARRASARPCCNAHWGGL